MTQIGFKIDYQVIKAGNGKETFSAIITIVRHEISMDAKIRE